MAGWGAGRPDAGGGEAEMRSNAQMTQYTHARSYAVQYLEPIQLQHSSSCRSDISSSGNGSGGST